MDLPFLLDALEGSVRIQPDQDGNEAREFADSRVHFDALHWRRARIDGTGLWQWPAAISFGEQLHSRAGDAHRYVARRHRMGRSGRGVQLSREPCRYGLGDSRLSRRGVAFSRDGPPDRRQTWIFRRHDRRRNLRSSLRSRPAALFAESYRLYVREGGVSRRLPIADLPELEFHGRSRAPVLGQFY